MSMVPRWYSKLPAFKKGPEGSLWNWMKDIEGELSSITSSGLSISSDEKCIYVEADVPGLTAQEVEVSVDSDGLLWIKGEKKAEAQDKEKKYYHRSVHQFSYCLPLSDEIDLNTEPQAACKNGVMKITFAKKKEKQKEAKKIRVKGD